MGRREAVAQRQSDYLQIGLFALTTGGLIASVVLMTVVALSSWALLAGQTGLLVLFIIVYAVLAVALLFRRVGAFFFTAAASLVVLAVAALSLGGWFDRHHPAFTQPMIGELTVAYLLVLLVVIQVVLFVCAIVHLVADAKK